MRIAINTLSLNRTKAGMGNYIFNLINSLASIDKKNEYYVFVSDKNKQFFDIRQKNFRIINAGKAVTKNFRRLMWEQLSLPKYIKKHKIDVLHSPGFVIPFLSKAKNILTIADMTFISHPKVHTLVKRFYFGLFMPPSIRKTDKILSISKSTKKDISDMLNINAGKIEVTHLSYGKEFKILDKKNAKGFLSDNYSIDYPFILFVGMIEPRKNLKRVLKAFSQLKKQETIPQKLVIVGKKGWMYKGIFKTVKRLGLEKEIIFTGYVPDNDLVKFYNSADVLVYPCLYEGFGIPILEAMACECPVITSNVSSMPEVAGDAALFVNPIKTDEIASAMKKVITNKKLQKKLREKGKLQCSKFSWKKTAEKTLLIYEREGNIR